MLAGCEKRQPRRMPAMPKTLENVRQTKRFGTRSISRERGDAGEFVVGFVHHDDGVFGARQNALDAEQS